MSREERPDYIALRRIRAKCSEKLYTQVEIERLLAQEREPMECGHPKACLVDWCEKMEGPAHTAYCSACVEREKAREIVCKHLCYSCEVAIRQLDLTKPESDLAGSSREEGRK